MEYVFEELEPIGYPGVMAQGWAIIEKEYGDWYVASIFVGDREGEHKCLFPTDPFGLAIIKTLSNGKHEQYIRDELFLRS